ncbi:MAG: serine hydrolase domain-containing protein [Bacteroidota bacterium]
MKTRFTFLFVLGLLIACQPQDEIVALSVEEEIRHLAAGTTGIGTQHALSFAVFDEGKWASYHFGLSDPNGFRGPDDSTLYAIGEISETFTATLLADQVLRAKLAFSDTLGERWPGPLLGFFTKEITMDELASHTSGMPLGEIDLGGDRQRLGQAGYFPAFSEANLYELINGQSLINPPGEAYLQSSLNMVILAHILELINNQDYYDLLRSEILVPNEMNSTRDLIHLTQSLADQVSPAWDMISRPLPHYQFGEYQGSQTLYSNLSDMRKWADIMLAPFHPFSDAVDLCLQPHFSLDSERAVGYGWQVKDLGTKPYFFKEGSVHHTSHIRLSPSDRQALIILSNTDNLPEIRWMSDMIWRSMQQE